MILADENIHADIIIALRQHGYNVYSVKENKRGERDINIAAFSVETPRIILTSDKDFGEIVFAQKKPVAGVILLRFSFNDRQLIILRLINFLETEKPANLYNKFVTITIQKIRVKIL